MPSLAPTGAFLTGVSALTRASSLSDFGGEGRMLVAGVQDVLAGSRTAASGRGRRRRFGGLVGDVAADSAPVGVEKAGIRVPRRPQPGFTPP